MTSFTGGVLCIKPFSYLNNTQADLFLVQEKEWICILNARTEVYIRILRIPLYSFKDNTPSTDFVTFIKQQNNTEENDETYDFALIWGNKGGKVANYRIDKEFLKLLDFKDFSCKC